MWLLMRYRDTDNRNRLVYSDWWLSRAVSNIGYCCLNGDRWHIFGAGSGAFGSLPTTITFSRMNDHLNHWRTGP